MALSYILGAVGPVTLPDGEKIDADNVVRITESEAYARFADDNTARKAYLQSVAGAVIDRVLDAPGGRTTALLAALGRAAGEGRMAVYSADPGEQTVLAGTPLGRTVPDTAGPYANVVVNNAAGNKLDYYLGRSIRYAAGGCNTPSRDSTVDVTLKNGAPPTGLSDYVAGRRDENPQGPPGTTKLLVSLYATQGALLRGATLNGVPLNLQVAQERGHPILTADVVIAPGASATLHYDLLEPVAAGAPQVPVQPLVLPADVAVDVPECVAIS